MGEKRLTPGEGVKVTVGIPTFNRADMLGETIASVVSQSYRDFRLLIADNASDDNTQETVQAFRDPRIDYIRSEENIGMIPNFNRVIALTQSEFLVLLPDDDLLYPDHLRSTVEVLERFPTVGAVDTSFDVIDRSSRVVEHARTVVARTEPLCIEPRAAFLERSMQSTWTICWPTTLFRTRAIKDAGGLRTTDEPFADIPMLMRIALDWDFASLSRPLGAFRFHSESATAAQGSFTGAGYDLTQRQPRIYLEHRKRFLDAANLPATDVRRYRAIAKATFRRDELRGLATRGGAGASWYSTSTGLAKLIRREPRTLLLPAAWRLCLAQLGGRQAKRMAQRVIRSS